MSQARVTDFFSQRKRVTGGPVKPAAKPRGVSSTRTRSAKSKDASLCSSAVHEEFVRVIDEAAGINSEKPTAVCTTDANPPSSPRTPKRTSADAEFDLGGAVFSATAEHSTAKKRRQAVEAAAENTSTVAERPKRKTARKKLQLPPPSPQAVAQPLTPEGGQQPSSPAAAAVSEHKPVNHVVVSTKSTGQSSKVLCKEDIATLKFRLQKIKKHAEETTRAASVSTSSSCSSPVANNNPSVPQSTTNASSEAKALKLTVTRAKHLAAKAQRRQEEREAEEKRQSETRAQDSAQLPAYQQYYTLAQAVPPGLSLPYQYKLLAEMFRSMDTVVAMLHNRCETATFAKVKQGVQDMMHKRFEESHVGQMKKVFPDAYTFRQEKNIPTFNSSIKKGSYQLTVEPIIPCDQNKARPTLSASHLLERRQIFHQNLVHIVKQHHKEFLSSLVPPVSVPEDKLTRWHPRFNVDTVPAVQPSSLPQPPHAGKLATAQEVLDKARSLITPKMEKALVSLTLKSEDKSAVTKEPASPQNPVVPQTTAPPAAPAPQVPTALKGVSQSLLDRIRAKEAQKLQAAMTRNPSQEERLLMMSRLGELARILRAVFVAEKKPALIMEVACNRMVASYRSALSTGEMEKHLRLLAEVAADWLTIHPIRKDFYLKLNRNMELGVVLDQLNIRLREEEKL